MKIASLVYHVWLAQRLGAASKYFLPLSEYFEDAFEIYLADEDFLTRIKCLPEDVIASLCNKELESAQRCIQLCSKYKIKMTVFGDANYPTSLMNIEDPPVVLYYLGELPDFSSKLSLSIVGTRKMSEYGKHIAYRISYELGAANAITVSGMALGIDGVASCGALEGGGKVVAVLGSGLDIVYPREHRKLMELIKNQGAVISEFPPGTPPDAGNFPIRNRIISALSMGTLVIEGDLKSGSLITAKYALYQGKPVFAIPGNVDEENAEGTNRLLRAGANVVVESDDIVNYFRDSNVYDEINIDEVMFRKAHVVKTDCDVALHNMRICSRIYGRNYNYKPSETSKERLEAEQKKSLLSTPISRPRRNVNAPKNEAEKDGKDAKKDTEERSAAYALLNDKQKKIFDSIPENESITLENLSNASGCAMSDILVNVTILELKGLINILPGGKYGRK